MATPSAPLTGAIRPRIPQPIQTQHHPLYGVAQSIGRILLLFLLLIGLCTVFDEVVGDGDLPHFNTLKAIDPDITTKANQNTTAALIANPTASIAWQAMAPSRDLLTALSPEIAAWLYQLHQENRIIYTAPTDAYGSYGITPDARLIAAYRHLDGKLYLSQEFWALSDGQKVVVLAHEYRHYRQNAPKRLSHMLAQLLSAGRLRYHSAIEDEAFSYERQAQSALGI